jgi:single-strand DNA-binding protein
MAATNINRIVMTGNLTADPELRSTRNGMSVCHLRLACNTRRKDPATGEWGDKPNYFNVTVWGAQGENAARYLAKGRPIAIDGRLEWREWENANGEKRQGTEIIADSVQFLGAPTNRVSQSSDTPPTEDFVPVPAGVGAGDGDPDIPF